MVMQQGAGRRTGSLLRHRPSTRRLPNETGAAAVPRALPANGGVGDSGARDLRTPLPLPPPPLPAHGRGGALRAPPAFLQPLLNAVVAVSGGRLASLPPAVVAWLLRALLSVGHCPPPVWLAEAYDSLMARVDELQPNQAAQAYLAIASLAAASHTGSETSTTAAVAPPPPPPPPELLARLYGSLVRPGRGSDAGDAGGGGAIDPRVALACLEAAAAVGESLSSYSDGGGGGGGGGEDAGASWTQPSSTQPNGQPSSPGASASAPAAAAELQSYLPYQLNRGWSLSPAMPQAVVEALVRRAAGLRLVDEDDDAAAAAATSGGTPGLSSLSGSPEAAVAAARAVVAAARLSNPPRPAAVADLASLIARNCGGGGGGGAFSGGGAAAASRGSPQLLVHSLLALCVLGAAPLSPPNAEALVSGLEQQLSQLDAVQVSYCVAAVQRLAAEPAALRFARGPAAAALARQLPDLPVPRLAAALAALPPPLQPPPAELAAAAHEALRRGLAAADSDNLAEVLRQLSDADALPLYGWQGALAAALAARLAEPAAAALISSQELCNTLFLLAALNYRPSFGWTAAAAAALAPRLLTLSASQLTNALWSLAKFGYRPEAPWSTSAVQALQLQLPSLAPHQLSYGLGSLQRMGCHVSGAVLDEMLTAAAAATGQLASYPPADLVLLLMTVARLRHVPSYAFTEAVSERLRPHLAATLAAAPLQRRGPTAAGQANPLLMGSQLRSAAEAGAAAEAEAVPLTCQELASVGYALAKLHSRPEAEWMSAYMDACLAVMPYFSPDLLASLLWAVGELGQVPDPAWISAVLASSRPRLGEFAPQDLVSVLSSLAALRCPPPAEWLGEALSAVGARVGGLDGEGVTALLKALVDLDARVSNPQWYDALCDQVSAFLPLLSAQGLVDLVASLGVLGHKPSPEWLQRCSAAAVRAQAQAAQGAAAAAAAAAAASGGGGGNGGGGGLSLQQLEALVCGLARLGAAPPAPLLQAFFAATSANLTAMPPDRVTALASALAGAKVAPEPAWLDGLAAAVRNGVMSYTLVQLDALTRALAVFQGLVPEHAATKDLLAFLREFCLYG
ncbi:hypothetical protein PLESTM_000640000 [Pleodorina starrii]|nr:hypothetical protein PLESTM_000640000 [Pleodorina starrii]